MSVIKWDHDKRVDIYLIPPLPMTAVPFLACRNVDNLIPSRVCSHPN